MVQEGGCLCGAVRHRVIGPAHATSICHCESCRRATGEPSVARAISVAIDHRTSPNPGFSDRKMPSFAALRRIVLKRRLVAGGGFWDWHRAILPGRVRRRAGTMRPEPA
jgi:hypothetical protein